MSSMFTRNLSRCFRRLQIATPISATNITQYHRHHLFFTSCQFSTESGTTFGLESDKLNEITSKLSIALKLSNEQVNFVLLKCSNTAIKFENDTQMDQKIDLIKTHFEHEDICHNLELLSLPLNDLKNRVSIFTELGFDHLSVTLLNALPHVLTKTVGELKGHGLYPNENNPCPIIINCLLEEKLINDSGDDFFKGDPKLLGNVDSYKISELRSACLVLILRQLQYCSEHVAAHMVDSLNSNRNFDKISFRNLIAILNVFTKEVHLPLTQIIRQFSQFISYNPENLRKLANIQLFKDDTKLRSVFFFRHRLLLVPSEQIEERISLLMGKYKCTIDQLHNCMIILENTVPEIDASFAKFLACDKLKPYHNHKHLLRLIINIDQALANVGTLDNRNISTSNIAMHSLLKSNSRFLVMVKNSAFQLTLNSFTTLHFDSPLKDLKMRIGSFAKTGNLQLNSLNANNIIDYFRAKNLSDEQILNGIYLIYFDFETVTSVWEKLFEFEEVKKSKISWPDHPYVLQLLYYFLERTRQLKGPLAISPSL